MDAASSLATMSAWNNLSSLFLFKPVVAHCDLHGVDAGIRHIQPCIGNMFIASADGDGLIITGKKMEPGSAMGGEIYVCRRRHRYRFAGKEHAAANFHKWSDRFGRGEIPRHIQRVEGSAISVIFSLKRIRLNKVIERDRIG